MNEFRWLDSMSVGIAEFDDDHRRIVALLGRIAEGLERGDQTTAIGLAAELTDLVSDHIRREGAFLRRIKFPDADNVVAVQHENMARLCALADGMRTQSGDGGQIAMDMTKAFVAYLLRADINYKSFVEHMGLTDR